jgi:transketolase
LFNVYEKKFPELASELNKAFNQELPDGWINKLPQFDVSKEIATREASGKTITSLADTVKFLIGGSADLAPSNNTYIKGLPDFKAPDYEGRNFHFGVREHAMGSILNGMALSKAIIPYGGTFMVFADYMKPAIRLAAMMKIRVIYVFTHDSIGLGEDGPTHQPIEQLAMLRSIPNLVVIRPSDASETAEAWKVAIQRKDGPTALILTRQKFSVIDRTKYPQANLLEKGAYILSDSKKIDIILIASGSEVFLAINASQKLVESGIGVRVVAMPSWELFEKQPEEYKKTVLPPEIKSRLAIEALTSFGWHKYVGLDGDVLSIERFGSSGPYKVLFEKFGFTVDNVIAKANNLLKK